MRIADNGAPVEVDGVRDLKAALTYSKHRNVALYCEQIWKFWSMSGSDVHPLFGVIHQRLFWVCVFLPSVWQFRRQKNRIIHDLTFIECPGASSVNAKTYLELAPSCAWVASCTTLHGGFCCCGLATLAQQTSPRDAVVTKQCRNATQRVEVKSPVAPECSASFSPGVQTPSGSWGGEGA